jgi:lipid II:glycine glycyltransferase (peptidoglycan interpeptide bridge formation enzyme)
MSIILYANGLMHYHLSGSLSEFRHLAPTNLLLYEAAIWGCEQGFRQFHLGGGVGSQEDSLYKFKEGFNRNSDCRFAIAKQVFMPEMYNELVKERKEQDVTFDEHSSFFPLYRV